MENKKNTGLPGGLLILLAGVFWGSMGIFTRPLNAFGFSSLHLVFLRLGLGAAVFALPAHPVSTALRWGYVGVTGLYAAATFLSSFSLNPFMWLLTWLGVVASHLWYGIRFMQGLCASRAPCEYIGRDHAGK